MRRRVLITVCVVLLGAATAWLLAVGDLGARIATVLALTVGISGLIFTLFGVSFRVESGDLVLADEARSLNNQAGTRGLAEQQKLLADSGRSQPADVEFVPPDVVTWRSDGTRRTGSLSEIAGFYRGLGLGRLLILGNAGAGKTVLANQLLIELARQYPLDQAAATMARRVPVRLSLPSFDPGYDHAVIGREDLAGRLDAWISRRLAADYGITTAVAKKMVDEGWIVPVLDGLDEMDSESGPATRAAAVVRALNHPRGPGLPCCRHMPHCTVRPASER